MFSAARLLINGLWQRANLWRGAEGLLTLQQRRLRALIAYAQRHSPFYADTLRGVEPGNFQLDALPIVAKAQMMGNFDRFLTRRDLKRAELEAFMADPNRLGAWFRGKYALSHTSGTSGLQAIIVQDRRMLELLFALQMLRGSQFARSPWSIAKRLFRRTRLATVTIGQGFFPSASALAYQPAAARWFVDQLWIRTIEPLAQVVAKLNRFRPEILLAYANVLEMLAGEALGGRLHVKFNQGLRQVINMSEPLSAGLRTHVEKAFGLKLTDNYAMGECMALSTGCLEGKGMHLQADWAILEVVDADNRPVPPGQPGTKALLTNLYNTLQPFIRYEVNDVVTMSPEPCPCGSPLPLILRVEGRTDDILWIKDGDKLRPIHPYVLVDVLDECPECGWYQFEQVERNRLILRAAPAPSRTLAAEQLRRLMDSGLRRFGLEELLTIDIEITPDICPNRTNGKLRRIKSMAQKAGEAR